MAKLRRKRRVDTPRIEWRKRLQMRRRAPFLLGVALSVLLLAVLGGLAMRQSSQALPTPTPAVALDPEAAAIGALIQQAEQQGQVSLARPSAPQTRTPTPTPTEWVPPTPWPTPTPIPLTATPTPTLTPTLTPSFIVSDARLPIVDWEQVSQERRPVRTEEAAFLEPMAQVYQDDNPNEAPSVAAMLLSFYGFDPDKVMGSAVKKLPYDRASQVALPGDLVRYFEESSLEALIYEQVTLEQLQSLISNGVPVIVAQTLTPDNKTPHYRVVRGYSDLRGVVMANDPAFAASLSFSYAEFEQMWAKFEGFAMPVFLSRQEAVVRAILGEEGDKTAEYVEHDRKLGDPPIETPTPTPTAHLDNRQPDSAWPIQASEVLTGTLVGNAGGAFGYLRFSGPESAQPVIVDLHYAPDDAIIGRAVGFNVYGPQGDRVGGGTNTTGRGGERSLRLNAIADASYLVQVYNYLPNFTLAYTVSLSIEGSVPPTGPSSSEARPGSRPVPTRAITPATAPTSAPTPTGVPPPTSTPAPTSPPAPTLAPSPSPRPTNSP